LGGSTIASFIMLFFVIIIIISTTMMVYTTIYQSNESLKKEQQRNLQESQTSIEIINATYLNVTNEIEIYIKNIGKRKLDINETDIYINDIRIPRNNNNRTIEFIDDSINPLLWDPNEIIRINVFLELEFGNHYTIITTEFGIKDNYFFSY
jgi:archaellum component FlaF (FlaF/FlaG flagellin family)